MCRGARQLQFPLYWPPVVEQLTISPAEISVEGWIKDGVQGRVEVAQPKYHRVQCGGRIVLGLYAHEDKVGKVREPADNEGPQNCSQCHCGLVLLGNCRI